MRKQRTLEVQGLKKTADAQEGEITAGIKEIFFFFGEKNRWNALDEKIQIKSYF